jgi:hypothetical protein
MRVVKFQARDCTSRVVPALRKEHIESDLQIIAKE